MSSTWDTNIYIMILNIIHETIVHVLGTCAHTNVHCHSSPKLVNIFLTTESRLNTDFSSLPIPCFKFGK